MRRRLFFFLCLCALVSLAGSSGQAQVDPEPLHILEADAHHLLLELQLPSSRDEPVTHDGITYRRLHIDGWGNWGQPGEPQLPMLSLPVGMPWLDTPRISLVEVVSETLAGYGPLYPVPAFALAGSEADPQIGERFELDAAAYAADTFYPGALAEAADIGLLRDQPLFQLRLYPFQYNPQQRVLRVYRRIRVRVDWPAAEPSLTQAGRTRSSPVFEHILERTLLNYHALPPSEFAPSPLDRDRPVAPLEVGPRARIEIEQEGLYRVTYASLAAAAPDLAAVDPRLLELSSQGTAVPIFFDGQQDGRFDAGDSFYFYAQAIDSDYAWQNAYWLAAGSAPGLRMAQRDGTPSAGSTPAAFADPRHYEDDRVYLREIPGDDDVDRWFWDDLSVSGSTPVSAEHTFALDQFAASGPNGKLRVMLYGANYGAHLTQLYLNGTALLSTSEQSWSGRVTKLYEVSIPQSLLVSGNNTLRVRNTLPSGASSSEVTVNWFEITYQDTYVAEEDRLRFAAPSAGSYTFELSGLSSGAVELVDISDPALPVRIVNAAVQMDGGSYHLRFSDSAAAGQRYLAQGSGTLPVPSIRLDEPSAWKSPANGATYLIITPSSLYDAVQPLAAYRTSVGEMVVTAKVEDVYDEFSGGVRGPQAIRSFLEYAYQNWSPRPVTVLLVGDASVDPKNNMGSSLPDMLPVHYVDTPVWGQTPDDGWYTQVHGDDDYPDLIIGRIPARTAGDLAAVVSKIQGYESSPPSGDWKQRAVLVADDGESAFQEDMNTIADLLPGQMAPIRMFAYDASTSVRKEVSRGALFLAYSGHGLAAGTGWGNWSGKRIFDQPEIAVLENSTRLPFMTVANCLSGWFDQPDLARAMAEEFLLIANKGGIASWAPASYGFPTSNSIILEELYSAMLVDGDLTLGAAATSARVQASLLRPDLAASHLFEAFTYFGDPALWLYMPATLTLGGQVFPSPALIGEPLTYELAYSVTGAAQARGLTLVLTLPQGAVYQFALPPPSLVDTSTLTWNLGNTPAGHYTVVVTTQVKPDLAHGQSLHASAHLYDTIDGDEPWQTDTIASDSPIAGFAVRNDSPTDLGDVTVLATALDSGTNVVYTWDLGDGAAPQTGALVQHVYPAVGTYTARVTAANGVSRKTLSTTVEIVYTPAEVFVYMPVVLRLQPAVSLLRPLD